MLKNFNFKEIIFFLKTHIFLSIFGSALGILSTAIFFILISRFLDQVFLAKFSMGILFFFGILQFSLFGLDQNIIAHSRYLNSQKVVFDKKIFILFVCLISSSFFFLIIFKFKEIFIIDLYFKDLVILNLAVILGLICRILQAYLQASSKLLENAQANFFRYLGYTFFIIFWFKNIKLNIFYFFLFSELITLLYLVFKIFFSIGFNYSNFKTKLNLKYLFLGISQFSYESMFKLDLLIISIFGTQKLLILYTILSNIIEGIINIISVAHPLVNNFMNKFKINEVINEDLKLIRFVNYFSIFIFLLILPAYVIFNYVVFNELPQNNLIIIASLFSILLIFFRNLFLFFFFFSLNNMPIKQFFFSITMFLGNFVLNIILFKLMDVYGIAIATLIVYFTANMYMSRELKKYNSVLNFL